MLPYFEKNNNSAVRNPEFVRQEIQSLLDKGIIAQIDHQPYCCSPLTVASRTCSLTNTTKLREILRNINYIFSFSFFFVFSSLFDSPKVSMFFFKKSFFFSFFFVCPLKYFSLSFFNFLINILFPFFEKFSCF